jgi:hypothetical protein
LRDLGLIGAEETPSAADLQFAKETAETEIMLLSALGMPLWNGSEVSIPQEYLGILSRRVGLALAPAFGLADGPAVEQAMKIIERNLTILAAVPGPRAVKTNDAKRGDGGYSFATG